MPARTIDLHRPDRTGPSEQILSTYLDALLDHARERVATARARRSLPALRDAAQAVAPGPSLRAALSAPGVSVLAEVKRASPSKGPIAPGLDAAAQAQAYRNGGAAGVSVLTEPSRFAGHLDDLASVAALGVPALRKDFIVDPYQIWEAREAGAAAVLLIVAALDAAQLADLYAEARAAGLDVLVEIHDTDEVAAVHRIGADLVGVNARDLRTFEVDATAFARLRAQLPANAVAVAESGISAPADVHAVAAVGADAVLVGESLVRAADPARAVAALVAAGQRPHPGTDAVPDTTATPATHDTATDPDGGGASPTDVPAGRTSP